MTGLLDFHQVWVEYGDKVVLERVDLSVPKGAFISVVGPSGAGKSTFLRLVLGQEAPTRGSITLDGKPLRAEPGPDRGVVFQRYSVFPHLNALDNVVFGLDCAGSAFRGRLSSAKRKPRARRRRPCRLRVGLSHALDVYPAQLASQNTAPPPCPPDRS